MLKIMGSIMIGGSCIYFGLRRSARFRKRYSCLKKLKNSLSLLETEIAFKGTELGPALESADQGSGICGLFAEAAKNIKKSGIRASWSNAVKKCAPRMCLTPGDIDTLMMLGQRLGMTDTENQVKNIAAVRNMLDIHINAAKYDTEHFCRLYTGGGVLAGVFLILVLL